MPARNKKNVHPKAEDPKTDSPTTDGPKIEVPKVDEQKIEALKKEVLSEMETAFGLVPNWVRRMPAGAMAGFWTQRRDFAEAETHIPAKYKELIALAVAGSARCRYSVYFHTAAARLQGATDEEIVEAAALAGLTASGSAYLNALDVDHAEFVHEVDLMMAFARQHSRQRRSYSLEEGEERHAGKAGNGGNGGNGGAKEPLPAQPVAETAPEVAPIPSI